MSDSFDKVEYATRLQSNFVPNYQAIYNLFVGNGSNAVNEATRDDLEQAKINFQSVETLGEVIAKPISGQSTEIPRFKSGTKTKSYNKYLNGIAWKKKGLQPTYDNFSSISNQALDKILMQEDKEFLTGIDADGNQVNNGLFVSNDPDYIVENDTATPATLSAMKQALDADLNKIRKAVSGVKYIFSWGTFSNNLLSFTGAGEPNSDRIRQDILASALPDVNFINPISDITAGANAAAIGAGGYLIVTPSQVRLHHGLFTKILSLGYNEEEMRIWLNIGYNSKSLEVMTKNAIVKRIYNS